MSISGAMNAAVSGLNASTRMADIVANNLSNALTEGYGLRSVALSAAQLANTGTGVRVDGVLRFSDPALIADRRGADAALANHQRRADALLQAEQRIGSLDDGTGLSALFAAFTQSLISASGDPSSKTRLLTAVTHLSDLAETLRNNTRSIQALRQDSDADIRRDVQALNTGLAQVATLNRDIQRTNVTGGDPSGLLDQRQRIIDMLAPIIPLQEMQRQNGAVALITKTGITLLDGKPVTFGFVETPTITADMTLASGALGGVSIDDMPIDVIGGSNRLGGGSLGAAFALRDDTLVANQSALDAIAIDLIARFQDPANDPSLTAGTPGLLTDGGGALNTSDLVGLAGRVALNTAIDPLLGGNPALLRDGLNAPANSLSGDGTQITRWINSLSVERADTADMPVSSANARIGQFISDLGAQRLSADDARSFAAARQDTLRIAERANGVDSDQELQRLLQIEKAYTANAKVIQTIDSMLQRILEI